MSKSKDDPAHTKIYGEYAIFDIHADTCILMCQIWYDYVNRQKSCGLNTKPKTL